MTAEGQPVGSRRLAMLAARARRLAYGLPVPLGANPLFDGQLYHQRYPDVGASGLSAYRHYRRHGLREGRDPCPYFDVRWYLARYPDVRAQGIDPLDHYYFYGAAEGRDPGPDFDTDWYLSQNPDVAARGINPLLHYLRHGVAEGRRRSPSAAWLRIEPPQPPWSLELGTVTVSWDAQADGEWEVLACRDGRCQSFAGGRSGRKQASWITERRMTFRLTPRGQPEAAVAEASTYMARRPPGEQIRPLLRATPNPVSRQAWLKDTPRLDWDTGDGSWGQVMLVRRVEGRATEVPAGTGAVGTRMLDFILPGESHEFRLYRGEDDPRLVASEKVRPTGERRELVLDVLALVALLGAVPAALLIDRITRLRGRRGLARRTRR